MSDKHVQIFISYARNDDLRPPDDQKKKGFVTALKDFLDYELTKQGEPRPELWWDLPNVEDGDQFDPLIKKAIEELFFIRSCPFPQLGAPRVLP